ncbi:MAG: malate synthase A, partial [Xanthomonadales bacterium]|nr:malate synthase A [Xanthomonadales bacterium]
IFDEHMPKANQVDRLREDIEVGPADLVAVPEGTITEAGVRGNIRVAIQYLASWLAGQGCVPIDYLMEDAATAEIARAQLWQWVRYPEGRLDDGRDIDFDRVFTWLDEELAGLGEAPGRVEEAAELLRKLIQNDDFTSFLTLPAYEMLD